MAGNDYELFNLRELNTVNQFIWNSFCSFTGPRKLQDASADSCCNWISEKWIFCFWNFFLFFLALLPPIPGLVKIC